MKKTLFERISTQATESTKFLRSHAEAVVAAVAAGARPRVKEWSKKLSEQAQAAQVTAEKLVHQSRKSAGKTIQKAAKKSAAQLNIAVSRTVVNRVKRSARDAVCSIKESGAEFKAYLESEEFEHDLDTLAKRLGKHEGTYENFSAESPRSSESSSKPGSKKARLLRVHSKARFLFKECREDVLKQATRKVVIFEIPINPKLAVALALIFSGVKTTEIILHGIEVFAPRKKPAKVIRIR